MSKSFLVRACGLASLATYTLAQTTLYTIASGCLNPETPMPTISCLPASSPKAVHIIAVRGSNEPSTTNNQEGPMISVSNGIVSVVAGSNSVGLDYPDSPSTSQCVVASVEAGWTNLTNYLTAYNNKCPTDKIVLMGYSQGATVVGDVICGRTEASAGASRPGPLANQAIINQIAAVILFGDPARNKNQPGSWNQGNATTALGGYNPRDTSKCPAHYTNILGSFCQAGDYYCDCGLGGAGTSNKGKSMTIHEAEVQTWTQQAISFAIELLL